jgi:drug/metabolite transporter (DMT)-like permease
MLSATQVAVYVYLVPVFAMLFARLFPREAITAYLAVGAALIIGGVALTNLRNSTPLEQGG